MSSSSLTQGASKSSDFAFTARQQNPQDVHALWAEIFKAWEPIREQIGTNGLIGSLGESIVENLDQLSGDYGKQIEYDGFAVRQFLGGSSDPAQHMATLKALINGNTNNDIVKLGQNLRLKLQSSEIYVLHDLGLDGNCDDFFALLQFAALKKMIGVTPKNIQFVAVGGDVEGRKKRAKAAKAFFKDIPSLYVEAGAASPGTFQQKIPDNGYLTAFASQQVGYLQDLSLVQGNDYLVVIGQCGVSKTTPLASFGDMNDLFGSIPEPARRTLNVHVMGPGFNVFENISVPGWDFWTQFNSLFLKVTTTSAADCPSYSVPEWRELFAVAEKKYEKITMLHLVAIAQFFLTRYNSSFHSFATMFGMNGLDQLKFELDVAKKLLTDRQEEKIWIQSVVTKLDNMLLEQACLLASPDELEKYVNNLTAYKLITGELDEEEITGLLLKAQDYDTFWLWKIGNDILSEPKRTFNETTLTPEKIKTIRQILLSEHDKDFFTSKNVKIYTLVQICPTQTPTVNQLLEINRKLKAINAAKKTAIVAKKSGSGGGGGGGGGGDGDSYRQRPGNQQRPGKRSSGGGSGGGYDGWRKWDGRSNGRYLPPKESSVFETGAPTNGILVGIGKFTSGLVLRVKDEQSVGSPSLSGRFKLSANYEKAHELIGDHMQDVVSQNVMTNIKKEVINTKSKSFEKLRSALLKEIGVTHNAELLNAKLFHPSQWTAL